MPTVAMSMVENKQLWGIAVQVEEKLKIACSRQTTLTPKYCIIRGVVQHALTQFGLVPNRLLMGGMLYGMYSAT